VSTTTWLTPTPLAPASVRDSKTEEKGWRRAAPRRHILAPVGPPSAVRVVSALARFSTSSWRAGVARHAGGVDRKHREQAHPLLPPWMADLTARISLRSRLEATVKRSAFSASSRASRPGSRCCRHSWSPDWQRRSGAPRGPRSGCETRFESPGPCLVAGVSTLAMLEATSFWRALTKSMYCSRRPARRSSITEPSRHAPCHGKRRNLN